MPIAKTRWIMLVTGNGWRKQSKAASPIASALDFARQIREQSNCQIIAPGSRHWQIFTGLCQSLPATGNLISDVWFAALAIESGCEWITTDRDYEKFPGLRWRHPLTGNASK